MGEGYGSEALYLDTRAMRKYNISTGDLSALIPMFSVCKLTALYLIITKMEEVTQALLASCQILSRFKVDNSI